MATNVPTPAAIEPGYLSTADAARYIGMSVPFLEIGRCHGYGPPYVKLGRAIRYRRAALDAWMMSREHAIHAPETRAS